MGPIAVAAYSYMSLVPIIQPPVMKLFTTEKDRKIKMEQLRPVSKLEKILFPIIITIVVCLLLPTTAPLVGMLMLGNLFRECGVVKQLTETASNALMYIVVILLGTSVGASTSAEAFLNANTLKIVVLGLVAFIFGTAGGVWLGQLLKVLTHGKINPLIGGSYQFPSDACHGSERRRRYRYRSCCRYSHGNLWSRLILIKKDSVLSLLPGETVRREGTVISINIERIRSWQIKQ